MRRGHGVPLEQRVLRSAGLPLLGGAALTLFVTWSQAHWWVGPAVICAVVLAVLVLWCW